MSDDVNDRVKRSMSEILGVDESALRPRAKLGDDLEADELDLVELVMAIEEDLGIEIRDEDIDDPILTDDAKHTERRPATIALSSKYMRFDLPQRYLSVDNTVEEFTDIIRRIVGLSGAR